MERFASLRAALPLVSALAAVPLAAGCGGGPSIVVDNYKLSIADTGYVAADYFCGALANGQIKVTLSDLRPYCSGRGDLDAGAIGARDKSRDHAEVELVLAVGGHPNNHEAYDVGPVDCTVGPGMAATATFIHYPAGSTMPDYRMQASSGKIFLTKYTAGGATVEGNYDLSFGSSQSSGTFSSPLCP